MTSEWFKDWFETDEYLKVYRHRNESDAEDLINLIINNVSLPKSSQILDMACGTGRHSMLLAKMGFEVSAVDLSENMLAVARNTAEIENLKIKFIKSDLRNFVHPGRFDLILSLFTSFGYFENDEENFKILRTAYEHLKNKGYLVLDFFNKYYIELNLIEESFDKIDNIEIIQKRKIDGLRVVKEISIKKNDHSKNFYESVRMYNKDELISELVRIGFVIEKTFGDYLGNKFDQHSSPRIILIAKK